ncbi:hypothetical protein MSA03_06250 [Microbacterium saccharophilum]|nr:hypothetical protein MSA03_06250 [Microbacterium saccharophilum]
MSVARAVLRAGSSRLLTLPVTAAASLVTARIIIDQTGSSGFAVISTVSTLAQVLPFADLGVGAGVVNALAARSASDRVKWGTIASAVRIAIASALAIVVIALSVNLFGSWGTILGLQEYQSPDLDLIVAVALAFFAASVPLGIGQRVLVGLSRNAQAVLLSGLTPLLTLALTVSVVALSPGNWLLLAICPSAALACTSAVMAASAVRRTKFKPRWIFDADFRAGGLLRQGMYFTVITLTASLMLPLGRIIIARSGDLHAVADFSLIMQLYLPATSVVSAAAIALWPHFAANRSAGLATRKKSLIPVAWFGGVGVAGGSAVVLLGPVVATVVSGGAVEPPTAAWLSAGVLLVVQSLQFAIGMNLTTEDGLRFQALWSIPMSACAVSLTLLLVSEHLPAAPFAASAICLAVFLVAPGIIRIVRSWGPEIT